VETGQAVNLPIGKQHAEWHLGQEGNTAMSMREDTAPGARSSKVVWQNLESFVRGEVQQFIQALLEEEVTELLGRARSERRCEPQDPEKTQSAPVYRNGYGKLRRLCLSSGTVEVRRPRVRGLEERFASRLLPLFARRTQHVAELLPQLYLHGLAQGDFELALRGLLGEGAPLSSSSVARLKEGWQEQYRSWKAQPLSGSQVIYLWVDGIYVKAGLEKEKAALLVAIGALDDGSKVVLAVEAGQRESIESWSRVLRDLKARGMNCPRLVIGDGHLGIWGALANVFPEAAEQRCWNHRTLNVLDRIPKKDQTAARVLLTGITYAETKEDAERRNGTFQEWCRKKGCEKAGELLEEDWERMVAYYSFPEEHWRHLRTTNIVESPFAAVRLRTTAAKRYKKVENATAVIWKLLRVAESRFRKINAPELAAEVARGAVYENGVPVTPQQERSRLAA
jgi:putative transposase